MDIPNVWSLRKPNRIKNLREEYLKEYKFITDLLQRSNLPIAESDSSDSDIEIEKSSHKSKDGVENRAKSLEELHKRLAALKEQKTTYRGLKIKSKLQNKLKRKKKIQEKKTKRNERSKTVTIHEIENKEELINTKPPMPVLNNSNTSLVFSKFNFLEETFPVADKKLLTKTSGKRTLEKLQKQHNFLKDLEEKGNTEEANEMKDEIRWMNALKRSEGEKVKDDPQLLKKSLVKKQAKKKVSTKKWKDRLDTVENQKIEKQKKRKENLDKKIKEKKNKKLKKAAKKGRYVSNS